MAKEEKQGYVYVLTNPSFREDWVKIGKSSRPVNVRSKELDNTAVPLPFKIYATLRTSKYEKVEKQIHKQIDRLTDLRIRQNREFFNIAPDVALKIMQDIAELLDDAVITLYDDNNNAVGETNYIVEKAKETNKIYHCKLASLGVYAEGYYDEATKGFVVLKGATIRLGHTESYDGVKWREAMMKEITVEKKGKIETIKDYAFKSPTAASCFVLGSNSNGWNEWKDADGNKLDMIRKK